MPRVSRVLLVLVVLLVGACHVEQRQPAGPDNNVAKVLVAPDTITLDPLGVWQFGVYGRTAAGDSIPVSVDWSATAGLIDQSALYTADSSEDDVTITAQIRSVPGAIPLLGRAVVHKRRVIQLILRPDVVSLLPGTTQQFAVRGVRNNGDTVTVQAQYSATGGSITGNGLFTAGTTPGTYLVIATRRALADTATVTILNPPVASVSVAPSTAGLYITKTAQLTATLRDGAGNILSGRVVSWSSSAPGVATVSSNGMITAVGVGSATITATSEGKSGTAAVTVTAVPVASVTVAPATNALIIGATVQLSATTKDSAGTVLNGRTVTWSSSAPTVATVSASGMVTAVAAGSATITATSEGQSGTASVTVSAVPVASVTVSPATPSLIVGATVQLTATTKDAAGNVLTGRTVTWSSGTPATATVSAGGLVTAIAAGSVTITATSEGKSGTATVTVTAVPVASVTVAPATKLLRIGTNGQLTATTKDAAGTVLTGRTVTWSSNATTVATVSTNGLVTAVGVGSATITATSEGQSGTATITVTVVPVMSVTVSPAPGSVSIGSTLQLTAVTKDSAGNVLTGRVVTWSSNATTIATVSGSGLVSGVVVGVATISATSEGKSGTSVVTVIDPTTVRAGKYVSPSGSSSGDGTVGKPWDLATALSGAGGRIVPGDTVWLRGGTYAGSFTSSLRGTASAPIVVRQYPGERATLDGTSSSSITLNVDGQWTVYWGFEIKNTITTRFSSGLAARPSGVYVRNASNVKLVNLIIHDTGHGTYIENTAHSIEIYGWIVYNGGNDNSSRGDGHGIYVRNDGTTHKLIADNIIFNQFGFGIHSYAESGDLLKNITYEGNVLFNNSSLSNFAGPNMILGGETIADNDTIRNNFLYFSPNRGARNLRLGYTTQLNATADVEGNYIVGGMTDAIEITLWQNLRFWNNTLVETGRVLAFTDPNTAGYDWQGNTYYRSATANAWGFGGTDYTFSNWRQATGLGASDQVPGTTPTAPAVFVRPNKYEPGRANVIVFNFGQQSSVSVDLSNVLTPGQQFQILNVQDLFGTPVVTGTYSGGSVSIPMGGVTPPQPVGGSSVAPLKTGPDFDVFVVKPVN